MSTFEPPPAKEPISDLDIVTRIKEAVKELNSLIAIGVRDNGLEVRVEERSVQSFATAPCPHLTVHVFKELA